MSFPSRSIPEVSMDTTSHTGTAHPDLPRGAHGAHGAAGTTAPLGTADTGSDGITVIRSEERLVVGAESRPAELVRITKYVVTEEQTVTVPVRREHIRIERLPAPQDGPWRPVDLLARRDPSIPTYEVVLSEEIPVVTSEIRPREVVRVYVDRISTEETITAELLREQVDIQTSGTVGPRTLQPNERDIADGTTDRPGII
ncbi:MAG: YsnF/AvaK domain-containing protein [Actinomycetota bacterium]|nr:YsnF/AvaK domain-containing protein [Actinomycetota bacterium]